MFLQTVIETVYYLLRKLIEVSNRLLPDGAADWARYVGLCVLSTCTRNVCKYTVPQKSVPLLFL